MNSSQKNIRSYYIKRFAGQSNKVGDNEKMLLFSVLTAIILSKDMYPKNSDLKDDLAKMGITLKDYVYSSRTQVVARAIREVERANETETLNILKAVANLLEISESGNRGSDSRPERKNKVDDLLIQFGRGHD